METGIRNLASIQIIADLQPIPNADAIEVATVLGWKLVVKKGEFSVGDQCVYFEIDSLLPVRPEFEFLRPSSFKESLGKFRIKTVKLRGQISQGICFPKSLFTELENAQVGDDVTEIMGVEKYEVPTDIPNEAKGNYPSFIPKTDEPRIQAHPGILERHKGVQCDAHVKLDGASLTAYYKDGTFGVCSRNLELKESNSKYWAICRKYGLPEKLADLNRNIALQGELVGEGINGNRQKLYGFDLYIFSGYDIDKGEYLTPLQLDDICRSLELKRAPLVAEFDLNHTVDELIELSEGNCGINDCLREGIVVRAALENVYDPKVGRLSFKVINPKYLLKHND